jgi:hypothetical protein
MKGLGSSKPESNEPKLYTIGNNDLEFFWHKGASQAGNGCKMGLKDTFIKYFSVFSAILSVLKLESKTNYFAQIRHGYHKMQNSMLSLNSLKKKCKKFTQKKW